MPPKVLRCSNVQMLFTILTHFNVQVWPLFGAAFQKERMPIGGFAGTALNQKLSNQSLPIIFQVLVLKGFITNCNACFLNLKCPKHT